MQKKSYHLPFHPGMILAVGVFVFLLIYAYGYIFRIPYIGFTFNASNGTIEEVFTGNFQTPSLHAEDRIIQVGLLSFETFKKGFGQSLFGNALPGQEISVTISRGGKMIDVKWILPGINEPELIGRLVSQWWLGFVFWIFGTLGLFFIRPRDERYWSFALFNYLTAIWIVAGALSADRLWGSPVIMMAAFWFCVPVYWHFHWNFPQSLKRIKKSVWVVLYSLAFVISLGEVLEIIPINAFYIGFLLAILGSLLLLLGHIFMYPKNRPELKILGVSVGLMLIALLAVILGSFIRPFQYVAFGSIIAMPALPGAYFYIISRRQLGGMELRANQGIILFIYLILVFSAAIVFLPAASLLFPSAEALIAVGIGLILAASLLTIYIFPRFERWAQHSLLRMPFPPAELLETYTTRITTSLNTERLIELLRDQILPSLLIREAALLRLKEDQSSTLIFGLGLNGDRLPSRKEIPSLLTQSGRYRPITEENTRDFLCPWARLILKLSVEGQLVGLLLLGRRDPDDFYGANEIHTLQAMAQQTALALINIQQADRLSALYQHDIERQEAEHTLLAQELHDDVLGQLAMLVMNTGEIAAPSQFEQAYNSIVKSIRDIIQGLRPAMLNYGLQMGIRELAEELYSPPGSELEIRYQLPQSQLRYPPTVELHLFRIVQQACQNSLQHAYALHLDITGRFEPGEICLTVEDDGNGLETDHGLDLNGLLAGKHYGLAGMYERAALINARLEIISAPKKGTKVCVNWNANG